MRCLQCQRRVLAGLSGVRSYAGRAGPLPAGPLPAGPLPFTPAHTDYYGLDLSDATAEQALGAPRVERTRVEAAARKIAQRLFLHDDANRALLEEELEQDGAPYLQDYVDMRDAQPPAARLSSQQVSNKLFGLLGPPAQARARHSRQLLGDVARFMAAHQVVKLSDYHRMVRWLLSAHLEEAAADVMDTLLMSRQTGFGVSTYSLCLELAVVRRDAQRFGELVKRVKWPRSQWLALQHKFDAADFNAKDPAIVKQLASGFLQFNRSKDLTHIMQHTPRLSADLLAVNMRAAARWNDVERAVWTLDRLESLLRSGAADETPSLELLKTAEKIPAVSARATELRAEVRRLQDREEV